MIELIKEILRDGHDIIIEIKGNEKVITGVESKAEGFEINSKNFKKTFKKVVEKLEDEKPKRINWKTIKKIKEAKEDGLTSGEAAKDLGLPLPVVNKYWV